MTKDKKEPSIFKEQTELEKMEEAIMNHLWEMSEKVADKAKDFCLEFEKQGLSLQINIEGEQVSLAELHAKQIDAWVDELLMEELTWKEFMTLIMEFVFVGLEEFENIMSKLWNQRSDMIKKE